MTGVSSSAPDEKKPASRAPGATFILKKALISALVALVLFSLMIGIRTEAGPTGQLIYWTRFGELAAITQSPRSATAVAKGACEVIALDDREFQSGLRKKPGFALMLMSMMVRAPLCSIRARVSRHSSSARCNRAAWR